MAFRGDGALSRISEKMVVMIERRKISCLLRNALSSSSDMETLVVEISRLAALLEGKSLMD